MCPLFLSFMPVTIFCVRWIRPMTLVWNMTGERERCRPGFGSDGDVLTRRKEEPKGRGSPSMSSCEMSPTFSTPLTRPALLEQAEEAGGGGGVTESVCGIPKRLLRRREAREV